MALELFNEPQYYGLKRLRWPGLQRRLLDTVRAQAPAHLVLLSGSRGGSFESLSGLSPLPDAAVAYVFHHYEPFLFTHQGAVWQDERYTTAGLRQGLRYPPEAAHDSALPLRKPHPRAAQEMADHLKAGWGPQRLRAEMDRAGRWARAQGVRVLCNEFGCIRAGVDVPSRYRWIHDMRSALEANDIGWTLWDYTDIFGITAQSAQPGQQGRAHTRRAGPRRAGPAGLGHDRRDGRSRRGGPDERLPPAAHADLHPRPPGAAAGTQQWLAPAVVVAAGSGRRAAHGAVGTGPAQAGCALRPALGTVPQQDPPPAATCCCWPSPLAW